jgi:RNA polymerase sigma-70 factor (ECF subfamily)
MPGRLGTAPSVRPFAAATQFMTPPDDLTLMRSIAAGDREAMSQMYDRHAPRVLAVCRRVMGDAGEAEDVVTDVFFELWRRADRFDPDRGSPITYLMTLSRSRAIDRKRSRSSGPKMTSTDTDAAQSAADFSTPLDKSDSAEQGDRVRRAVALLDPAQRESIEFAFFDGLTHTQIAERLKKPLGSVKTYIRQGLIRLRENLRIDR